MKTLKDIGIDSMTIIQQHIKGAAEIIVNLTDRNSPDLFINGREYTNGTVTLICSFCSDEDDRFFTITFQDVPESIGNLIDGGLKYYAREKDQQYIMFVRFPTSEEVKDTGRIISEGELAAHRM